MFDTTMLDTLESAPVTRRWSTVASFTLQVFGVGVLLVFPLIYTEGLPQLRYAERLSVPASQRAPESTVEVIDARIESGPSTSQFVNNQLMEPRYMPKSPRNIVDPPGFASNHSAGPFIPGFIGTENSSAIQHLIAVREGAPPIRTTETRREPLRVSVLDAGSLVQRVQPVYPEGAKIARVQGPVVISAVIDTSGRIGSLRLISGHPFLVEAAMLAVKQWRYRPYILNGQPIEVETQITVLFNLN